MYDDIRLLRTNPNLFGLLVHYFRPNPADADFFLDRLMELPGVSATELSRLHGQLIASGWLEQNTGFIPSLRPGAVPQCYKLTSSGQRALNRAQTTETDDEESPAAA